MRARLVFGMLAIAGIEAWLSAAPVPPQAAQSSDKLPAATSPVTQLADSRLDGRVTYGITQKRVQGVVSALGEQVGLRYNWRKSYRHARPDCLRVLYNVEIQDEPFRQAIAEILAPVGLRYRIENDEIVLYRDRRQK